MFKSSSPDLHLEACIGALTSQMLDPTLYGWEEGGALRSLIPVMAPPGSEPAPSKVFVLVHYGYASDGPWKNDVKTKDKTRGSQLLTMIGVDEDEDAEEEANIICD